MLISISQQGVDSLIMLINELTVRPRTPARVTSLIENMIRGNEDLRYALSIMYDPLIKFYIKLPYEEYDVDYEEIVERADNLNVTQLNDILTAFHNRLVGRNGALELLWGMLEKNPLIALFVRKSLDLGFGVSSAKKLGIIASHSPQKGVLLHSYDDISYPVYADLKYNGSRLSVMVDLQGNVTCKLLRGQIISIPVLEDIFKPFKGKTFDGELVYTADVNPDAGVYYKGGITEADRIELSGMITSATANNQPLPMKDKCFIVYDLLETQMFERAKRTTATLESRRGGLIALLKRVLPSEYVSMATYWEITNATDLERLMNWVVSVSGEGLMIKSKNSTYDYRKNKQWYKLKGMKECDLKIVNYNVHTRNEKWIGSLVCTGVVDGKYISVSVGSGLNDNDRDINLFNRYYKDAIVMVTYMDVVQKGSTYSLSNPRFVKDRVDRLLRETVRPEGSSINY